jgi:hypothetical protein
MAEYIEREALLALETFMQDEDGFDCSCVLSADIRRCPAADVEPVKHGWWNVYRWNCESRDYSGKVAEVECSACGAVLEVPMVLYGLCYNFCPNCGARMDGE